MFWSRRLTKEEKDEEDRQEFSRLLSRQDIRAAVDQAMAQHQNANPPTAVGTPFPPMPPSPTHGSPVPTVGVGNTNSSFVDSISGAFRGIGAPNPTFVSQPSSTASAAASPGLVPTVSRDPTGDASGQRITVNTADAIAKAQRRYGAGKYIWDARVGYSLS